MKQLLIHNHSNNRQQNNTETCSQRLLHTCLFMMIYFEDNQDSIQSCETAITILTTGGLQICYKILLNLGKVSDFAAIDVWLNKLPVYQIDETVLSWFRFYQQGREQ